MTGGRNRFVTRLVFATLTLVTALQMPVAAPAQQPGVRTVRTVPNSNVGRFVSRTLRDDAGEHKYVVFLPAGYRKGGSYLTILFLHGASERGTDNYLQTHVGLGPYVRSRPDRFPFIIVFPQNDDVDGRALLGWSAETANGKRALAILDDAAQHYSIDAKRVSLVGWSMGGNGAWSLAAAEPDRWESVLALSAGGDPKMLEGKSLPPVWAIHGANDALIPVAAGQALAEAAKAGGNQVTFTELKGVGHDVFAPVFGSDAPFRWLLRPTDVEPRLTPPTARLASKRFRPDVIVPDALGLRLGNDALRSLSHALGRSMGGNVLRGGLPDIFDSTVASGRTFSIRFYGIGYSAQLEQAQVQAVGQNRIVVQLGIRNAVMQISGTTIANVSGGRQSAQTGPIGIYIGQNRPVWLVLDLSPYVDQRGQIRFRINSTQFSIPPDNWSVGSPAGVSVAGFGMTQERVLSGLMSGLQGSRGRIEQQVGAVAPTIVRQLEEGLAGMDVGPYLENLWPLPAFAPSLRAIPQSVTADNDGVSIVLSLAAESPSGSRSKTPRQVRSAGLKPNAIPGGRTLGVSISPRVLTPLTALVEGRLTRTNALDVPTPEIATLGERATLEQFIPSLRDLPPEAEVRTTFEMASPIEVLETQGDEAELAMVLPGARLTVASRPDANATWTKTAQFDVRIEDRLALQLGKGVGGKATLETRFVGEPKVDLVKAEAFGDGAATPDGDAFLARFAAGWKAWSRGIATSMAAIPDLNLGSTRLRIASLEMPRGMVAATFNVPKSRFINSSTETLEYQVRGPYTGFGRTHVLVPGKVHEYAVPYVITYRYRVDGQWKQYRLPPGDEIEYREPQSGGAPRLFKARPEVLEATAGSSAEDLTATLEVAIPEG